MCWLTNLIRQVGKQEGRQEGRQEGEDKAILKAYRNMKKADCKDNYICAMLGISPSKLRQIKKMGAAKERSSVNDYVLEV